MKTSNKILLTIFLAAIGILAGIYLALYAKYKSGRFTTMKDLLNQQYTRHELKPVRYLVVTGMDNLTIIPSDTPHVDIQKDRASRIRFRMADDSLVVSGDSIIKNRDGSMITERSNTNVNVYLPSPSIIQAKNTSFFLSGVTDKSKAVSCEINLADGANLELSRNAWQDSSARYYGRITVQAGPTSQVVLAEYAVLESLDLSMTNSVFRDEDAEIGTLIIQSDPGSSIQIHGKNLPHLRPIKN